MTYEQFELACKAIDEFEKHQEKAAKKAGKGGDG